MIFYLAHFYNNKPRRFIWLILKFTASIPKKFPYIQKN